MRRTNVCLIIVFLFFLVFSSIFCLAQTTTTATCTDWQFFTTFTPSGINVSNTVVGSGQQSDGSIAGYIRYSDGETRKYVDPHAAPPTDWTYFNKINAGGVTVGWYRDANQSAHGLLFSGSSFATWDYPGGGETILTGINKQNTIIGYWGGDFSQPYDGFESWANGSTLIISAPGAMQTTPGAISDTGLVVGYYVPDQSQPPYPDRGFVLTVSGAYKTLDYPGADRTFLNDVNSAGVIAGSWTNTTTGATGGFLFVNGTFEDVLGPNGEATTLNGINDAGYVTGAIPGSSFTAQCH
ncbi:MAG TPA: hypothetical protein VGM18_07940 [Candidatus Sulfotelmatobacter sp.]|jgi:hypothetical protein